MEYVEFRWHKSETDFGDESVKNIFEDRMVLQYRERLNPMEIGLQDAIWSGWVKVPFSDI